MYWRANFVGTVLLFLIRPIFSFHGTSLYVTHRSICFSIIWWGIQRILFLHTSYRNVSTNLFIHHKSKKNVYHVCKQRKRFFYFVTHLCVFTSGLRMRKEKENHIYLSILFQSLIFPNKDPSKPYLPTRCYSLSLRKYTEHYFKAEKKNSERKIHKSLYEFLNNKLYMSLLQI